LGAYISCFFLCPSLPLAKRKREREKKRERRGREIGSDSVYLPGM